MAERRVKRRWWVLGGIGLAVVLLAIIAVLTRPPTVRVVNPRVEAVVQAITASGNITGAQESTLAPDQPGILSVLLVQEGQRVQPGQVIARLSSPALQAEVAQADARVQTANAQLREAQAQARVVEEQVRQAQAESGNAIRQAEVRVAQARREVVRAEALSASEATARAPLTQAEAQLNQAEAAVASAQARVSAAQNAYARAQFLFREGAISRARLEEQETALRTARAELNQAIAQRNAAQTEVGSQRELLQTSRTERVEQARTALAAAEADLAAAREAGPARVRQLQRTPVLEQVEAARSQVTEAERAREVVQARLSERQVVAPYSGRITSVISEPGEVVGPTQGVVRISQMQRPQAVVEVDERDIAQIKPGQPATLITDAYPDRQLPGKVRSIAPSADPQRGTVEVTLVPLEEADWLRNGLTVDATIILAPRQQHLVVPATAVMREGNRSSVLIVRQNRLVRRMVVVGTSGEEGAVILAGLSPGDLVVQEPVGLHEGQQVNPVRAPSGDRR